MRILILAAILAASSAQAAEIYLTCKTSSSPDTSLAGHRKWYTSPPTTSQQHLMNLVDFKVNKIVWTPSSTYVIDLLKNKVTATDENREQVFEITKVNATRIEARDYATKPENQVNGALDIDRVRGTIQFSRFVNHEPQQAWMKKFGGLITHVHWTQVCESQDKPKF